MPLTFIAAVGGFDQTAGTTLDATASLNVAAGDLLIAWCKHEGAVGTFAVAKTTGGNDFTFDAGDAVSHSNNDLHGSFGYRLSADADATFTPRLTTPSRVFRILLCAQFRPGAGDTCTKDTSNDNFGTGTALTSGNITTTGTDEVVMGGYGPYTSTTTSSETINSVAATEPSPSPQDNGSFWYRILTSTFTGGNAAGTLGASADWIGAVIAIKAAAGEAVSPLKMMGQACL
jgi:hypothetical protein